jgi:hypothetical protein
MVACIFRVARDNIKSMSSLEKVTVLKGLNWP